MYVDPCVHNDNFVVSASQQDSVSRAQSSRVFLGEISANAPQAAKERRAQQTYSTVVSSWASALESATARLSSGGRSTSRDQRADEQHLMPSLLRGDWSVPRDHRYTVSRSRSAASSNCYSEDGSLSYKDPSPPAVTAWPLRASASTSRSRSMSWSAAPGPYCQPEFPYPPRHSGQFARECDGEHETSKVFLSSAQHAIAQLPHHKLRESAMPHPAQLFARLEAQVHGVACRYVFRRWVEHTRATSRVLQIAVPRDSPVETATALAMRKVLRLLLNAYRRWKKAAEARLEVMTTMNVQHAWSRRSESRESWASACSSFTSTNSRRRMWQPSPSVPRERSVTGVATSRIMLTSQGSASSTEPSDPRTLWQSQSAPLAASSTTVVVVPVPTTVTTMHSTGSRYRALHPRVALQMGCLWARATLTRRYLRKWAKFARRGPSKFCAIAKYANRALAKRYMAKFFALLGYKKRYRCAQELLTRNVRRLVVKRMRCWFRFTKRQQHHRKALRVLKTSATIRNANTRVIVFQRWKRVAERWRRHREAVESCQVMRAESLVSFFFGRWLRRRYARQAIEDAQFLRRAMIEALSCRYLEKWKDYTRQQLKLQLLVESTVATIGRRYFCRWRCYAKVAGGLQRIQITALCVAQYRYYNLWKGFVRRIIDAERLQHQVRALLLLRYYRRWMCARLLYRPAHGIAMRNGATIRVDAVTKKLFGGGDEEGGGGTMKLRIPVLPKSWN